MNYRLIRSKRKSIAIEIDREGTVTVRAPYRMPNVAVKAFIENKQDSIRKLNCLLMLAPSDVRDYVIIHELAHRMHMNHSKNFWKEVEIIIPDYKEKRKWLNTYGEEIMQRMRTME